MLFSVIVPFFNEAPFISCCIKALLNQDFNKDDYELIFIDNGSTDGSREIAEQFQRIILLSEHKKNPYLARNNALRLAQGSMIAFTDADCTVCGDWLKQIYGCIQKTGADIVLGERLFPRGSCVLRLLQDYENTKAQRVIAWAESQFFFAYANNMAVRTAIVKNADGFNESVTMADTNLLQQCLAQNPSLKIAYSPHMKITHNEITSAPLWLKKIHLYGKHNELIREKTRYRPLTIKKKIHLFYECTKINNYSIFESFFLLCILVVGDCAYKLGILKRRISS